MLPDNALQIKAVKGNTTDANVEWKGIGNMFGKTISTISISKDSPAYKAIGNNDVYLYPSPSPAHLPMHHGLLSSAVNKARPPKDSKRC